MVYTKEKTQEIAGAQDGRCFYQRKQFVKPKYADGQLLALWA